MERYVRDPKHWLLKYAPAEWIRAAMSELRRAEVAYQARDIQGGLACAKRAAGMALNAALIVDPDEGWGRSYVDHVLALGNDPGVPQAVRDACAVLLATHVGPSDIIRLRSPRSDERVLEAARDVIAHGYFVVVKHEGTTDTAAPTATSVTEANSHDQAEDDGKQDS